MAAAPRTAQWFTTADGTRHVLIEISSDSSDDGEAAGGLCDALAPLDPAAAQAGDASEDGESEEELVVAGALDSGIQFVVFYLHAHDRFSLLRVRQTRVRKPRVCILGFRARKCCAYLSRVGNCA